MVFHPLERRLDTAIFRALFASSTRMARQFVVHGHVKVNGKVVSSVRYSVTEDAILMLRSSSYDSLDTFSTPATCSK